MTYKDERDRLILAHRGLVRRIAEKMKASLPKRIDVNEMIGYGYLILIECAIRFDKNRGASFTTFATRRIRGGILDALYRDDMIPRHQRRAASKNGTSHKLPRVVSIDEPRRSGEGASWADLLIDRSPTVLEHVMRNEFPERFLDVLQRRERQILDLCFVKGYGTQEAADELRITPRLVRMIRASIVDQARRYYHENGFNGLQ